MPATVALSLAKCRLTFILYKLVQSHHAITPFNQLTFTHTVFSERELMFTFAVCYRPSVCRLSVICRLSVCRL